MLTGIFFVILATLFQLVTPWILRYAIDYIQFHSQSSASYTSLFIIQVAHFLNISSFTGMTLIFAGLILLSTLVQGFFRYLMRISMIGASRKIEFEMRNDYFSHLQTLEPEFYQQNKTGDLMARASNDLEAVRALVGPGIMHFVSTIFLAISAIFLMIKIDSRLTLWALLPLPIVVIIVNRLLVRINKLFTRIQAQFATVTAKVQENISGIRVVKSYVQEDHEVDDFKDQNKELVNRNLALAKVRAKLRGSIEFLLGLSTIIVLWRGGLDVISGKITIGGLVAFLAYLAMLAWPMIALGWVMNLWQQGLASLNRMLVIWSQKPSIKDTSATDISIQTLKGHITFNKVHFSYNEEKIPVLNEINLDIPAGTTLAIVGPTGSGKSTLVNLLPRLYDVTEGSILIDGHDIKKIPMNILRTNIGYAPQEAFLFSDTLEGNIGFGLEKPQGEEIAEAAESSQINLDMDQFPHGLQTVVGERGITLSGGQKQRIALSRAVIKKPKILILDDSLSAVDTYTEEEILKRLREIMKNRTSIIVSHRISTVKDADVIIVLDDGKILEKGNHEELIEKQGLYYHIYQKQMLEKSLEEL